MIIEGIITTTNPDGTTNVAAMGPVVDARLESFLLRPFQTSATFANLNSTRQAVFHVTDDVGLMASSAIGQLIPLPGLEHAKVVDGRVLVDCCRWFELRVVEVDATQPRSQMKCEVAHRGRKRDFFGFCRAKHAVVEAAILATRLEFLPAADVQADFCRLIPLVEKTGGPGEHAAFAMLVEFVNASTRDSAPTGCNVATPK